MKDKETIEDLRRQLDEALSEAAAEKIRADQAEEKLEAAKSRADGLAGQLEAEQTKYEALRKERQDVDVEKLQKENKNLRLMLDAEKRRRADAEDPEKLREAVRDRVELERKAIGVMGEKFRLDDLSDRQIREAVIERLDSAVPEDKSDAYVIGKFDALVKGNLEAREVMQGISEKVVARADEERKRVDTSKSAREKFIERRDNAWTQKESGRSA